MSQTKIGSHERQVVKSKVVYHKQCSYIAL